MDESNNVSRTNSRQKSDQKTADFRLLQAEFDFLRKELAEDQAEDMRRMALLESEVAKFNRRYTLGKGFILGVILFSGAFWIVVVDWLKQVMTHLKHAIG